MSWLAVSYQPTSLFTLKPSWATSTGGKSLLLPTPYALRMALLDVAIRTSGLAQGEDAWSWLRSMSISVGLPPQIVVTNLFVKLLRIKEIKVKASQKEEAIAQARAQQQWPFQNTIGFREYVYYPAPIRLAFEVRSEEQGVKLAAWLLQINYLGKRGGFVQLVEPPQERDSDEGLIPLTREQTTMALDGVIQQVDDCPPRMSFEQANIYEGKRPSRVTRAIVLPYRVAQSSKSYTLYEKIDGQG